MGYEDLQHTQLLSVAMQILLLPHIENQHFVSYLACYLSSQKVFKWLENLTILTYAFPKMAEV